MDASLDHTGLTDEEKALLADYNGLRKAITMFPEGSAMRGELDKRLASVEIKLGL